MLVKSQNDRAASTDLKDSLDSFDQMTDIAKITFKVKFICFKEKSLFCN